MRRWAVLLATLVSLLLPSFSPAQPPVSDRSEAGKKDEKAGEAKKENGKKPGRSDDDEPVVTEHEIQIGERTLAYTATAGMLPIRNDAGTTEAHIFYVAYTRKGVADQAKRPLMFSFNGGPGSASVWLHLGALGPKRIVMPDDAGFARPPFRLVDNAATWLDFTDLVFIDPSAPATAGPPSPS